MEGVRVSREWGCHNLTPNTKRIDTLSPQDQVVPRHFHLQSTHKLIYQGVLFLSPQGKPSHRSSGLAKKNTNLKILAQELFPKKRFMLYCEMN